MALKEAIKSEDQRRLEFIAWKLKQDTRSLPLNIMKFIGSLKKSVRETIRHKGGTPYSIVRELFVYWDTDKTGQISAKELKRCMDSLGVIITLADCEEVVQYYSKSNVEGGEMYYNELLKDISYGEPSLIAYVSEKEEAEANEKELRFEVFEEKFFQKPPIVVKVSFSSLFSITFSAVISVLCSSWKQCGNGCRSFCATLAGLRISTFASCSSSTTTTTPVAFTPPSS